MRYSLHPCIMVCIRTSLGEQSVPQKDSVRLRVGFQKMASIHGAILKSTLCSCVCCESSVRAALSLPTKSSELSQCTRCSGACQVPPSLSSPLEELSGLLPELFLYCVSVFCCIGRKGGLADSICLQWWQMKLKKNFKEKCFSSFKLSDLLCSPWCLFSVPCSPAVLSLWRCAQILRSDSLMCLMRTRKRQFQLSGLLCKSFGAGAPQWDVWFLQGTLEPEIWAAPVTKQS